MAALDRVLAAQRWCTINAADRTIRWSTALAVVGVAVVAAVVSYEHVSALVRAHGDEDDAETLMELVANNAKRFRGTSKRFKLWPRSCSAQKSGTLVLLSATCPGEGNPHGSEG
jgi:hypothetical protein